MVLSSKTNVDTNILYLMLFIAPVILICDTGVLLYLIQNNSVYGNGFSKSTMVCSDFENYSATLCAGIKPMVLKDSTTDKFSIRLELYDNAYNSSVFPNATFVTKITKNEYNSMLKDMPFLYGIFNSRDGLFTINVNKSETQKSLLSEETILIEPKTVRSDRVNLTLPLELNSGQYRFQTAVYVANREPLYFDSDLQVGDIESKDIVLNNKINNLTIISYYDKITEINFDPSKRTISWQIPFEYNVSKIDLANVIVHQEIVIPNSFLNLTNTDNISMTMNDNYFGSDYFYVDPYSSRKNTIIHYVPDINTLFDMSYNNSTTYNHIMKFVLFL